MLVNLNCSLKSLYGDFEEKNGVALTDIVCWVASVVVDHIFQIIFMFLLYRGEKGLSDLSLAFERLTLLHIPDEKVAHVTKQNKIMTVFYLVTS